VKPPVFGEGQQTVCLQKEENRVIRNARATDAAAICHIYNHYILNTTITFEELPLDVAEMAERIKACTVNLPWIVLEEKGAVTGYAYAGPWKARSAYRHTVESSVYLSAAETGRGLGTLLYEALFRQLREHTIHAVVAGITLPNQASVALHEKSGFVKVGHFREVGRKFNSWLDVGYWELLL
jgi:L-amino acid N-acyltransferase YncA